LSRAFDADRALDNTLAGQRSQIAPKSLPNSSRRIGTGFWEAPRRKSNW
jgi:hypothetical protein